MRKVKEKHVLSYILQTDEGGNPLERHDYDKDGLVTMVTRNDGTKRHYDNSTGYSVKTKTEKVETESLCSACLKTLNSHLDSTVPENERGVKLCLDCHEEIHENQEG